ncbi:MAG: FAD-binding oxidoreductase [Terriglobia bacterium]
MPEILQPGTPEELRDALAGSAAMKQSIELYGRNTRRLMAGLAGPCAVQISTARLQGIVQYEPRDLTISVQAGTSFADLNRELARNGQMIPLEGAYSEEGTVGGLVAANVSGPRRRLYGTARDLVIGMTFATVEGKLVKSGGMVVKNVAGLDMGKLMIGSFGTLAAIASVNFKVVPKPAAARTLLFNFDDVQSAMAARDAAINGVLTPAAVDVINPILAAQFNMKGFVLALMFAGNEAVIERSHAEAAKFGPARALPVDEEQRFWSGLENITPRHLEKFKEGAVVRISTTLSACGEALASVDGPAHAHAGSGIVRGWFTRPEPASRWLTAGLKRGWKGVVEYSGEAVRRQLTLWPEPGNDFEIMKKVKNMFDPDGLLNKGRLYDHI